MMDAIERLIADRMALGAALWVVQQPGECIMVMDASTAWNSAMCLLAIWGRPGTIDWMLGMKGTRSPFAAYDEAYLSAYTAERAAAWRGYAESAPFGHEYLDAARRWGEGGDAAALAGFRKRHGLNWAATFVTRAKEACYDAGRRARDVADLQGLRGVTGDAELRAAGAQLVARRPCATQWPTA